ncbi:MAG TPA: histidine kinase, partial [Candidatus Binatia bacterium]|nr:histidine kinase [Candidatus Binatia bacterium]
MPPKKPRRRSTPEKQPSTPKKGRGISKSSDDVAALRRELADALEQQTATSDILRMIAKTPGDLQTVLDAIA